MADYQLRARIPHEIADEIKEIVEEYNEHFPESDTTFSTISRYALKDYARRHRARGEVLFVEIPVKGLNAEQLNIIKQALSMLPEQSHKTVTNALEQLDSQILSEEIENLLAEKKASKNKG